MRVKTACVALTILVLAGVAPSAYAQKWELHPYIGHFNPRSADYGEFKNEGMYGLKGSVNLTPNFELEGNFGYLNHFELEGSDPQSRGLLWEAGGNLDIPVGEHLHPFVSGGIGGMTAVIDSDVLDPTNNNPGSANMFGQRLDDGDTFFVVSYGGGLKAERLWGPMGLRFDLRGRTMPHIFGDSATWLETTGGLTFSWGE